ncbi:MAG TPA: FAD-dependent oxidoreductase, partial [Nitrospirota bacterium]
RGASVSAVGTHEKRIAGVTIDAQDCRRTLNAAMVIDATGSGNIAAMAGAEFELAAPDKRQLAGFVFQVRGMNGVDESLGLKVPYHLAQAVKQGIFSSEVKYTTFIPGDDHDEGFCKMSIAAEAGPDRDEAAKKAAKKIHEYLSSVIPAFQGSSLVGTSLRVLDREGRRITGLYTLTKDDVLAARKFSDGVVKNAWPVELWDREKGTIYQYVPRGDYYEIPFRCLQAKGISNLLAAGRCISVTSEALGSTRVMGTCLSLGEQAGRAAAYHVKTGKYPEPIKGL